MVVNQDSYVLPRDANESERLQMQHEHLKRSFGGLLVHPSVQLDQCRSILDCCTGTGVWLHDARQAAHPDAIFEACDLTLEQYDRGNCEANEVYLQNITHKFPPEKKDKYDFIHQRYLTGGIVRSQWPMAIANVIESLKPGGQLNITEPNLQTSGPSSGDGLFGVANWKCDLKQISWVKNDLIQQCANDIPALMADAGLVDVRAIRMRVPYGATCRSLGMSEAQVETSIRLHNAPSFTSLLKCLWIDSGNGTAEEYERNQELYERFLAERGIWMEVSMVVGTKPLN